MYNTNKYVKIECELQHVIMTKKKRLSRLSQRRLSCNSSDKHKTYIAYLFVNLIFFQKITKAGTIHLFWWIYFGKFDRNEIWKSPKQSSKLLIIFSGFQINEKQDFQVYSWKACNYAFMKVGLYQYFRKSFHLITIQIGFEKKSDSQIWKLNFKWLN